MLRFTEEPPKMDQAEGYDKRSTCKHEWQPLSFVFECELLVPGGDGCLRPEIRQPGLMDGRVYCVCMQCASHTYVVTQWVGFYLGGDRPHENDEQPSPGGSATDP